MPRRGVRYCRAVPPPSSEWEGDFAAIARAGLDSVLIPVHWASSHLDDEAFDFSALLRQLELAHHNGLGLVAAIHLDAAPPWLISAHGDCLHEDAAGAKALPRATSDTPCGGWPGLCLDNDAAAAKAVCFLRALAAAVADHPGLEAYGLLGYSALEDLASSAPGSLYCQCAGSRARFLGWLRRTYGEDVEALGQAWGRRYRAWTEVAPPAALGPFPDALDWRRFQRENAAAQVRSCVTALRAADRRHPVIAFGDPIGTEALLDGALLAAEATHWGCHADALLPHEAIDRSRGAAGGKSLLLAGLPTRDATRIRLTNWSALASGADAIVYDAWRPELRPGDAPRPALARPDGARSERLAEAEWFVDFLARHPELAAARPAPPEVAIVVVPESQAFWASMEACRACYGQALSGAHDAFAERGARAELAKPEQLGGYPVAYVPLGMAMSAASAAALRRYVEAGGHLVAEACLAQFDERGVGGRLSPGQGLAEVFGARAADATEVPTDAVGSSRPMFRGRGASYPCFRYREALVPTTGKVKATFADGTGAIVDNAHGAGATRLIGTHLSLGYALTKEKTYARVILDSLAFARARPRVSSTSPAICVRLLEGDGVHFLCAFNVAATPQQAVVGIGLSVGRFHHVLDLATGKARRLHNNARRLSLDPASGIVLRLERGRLRLKWPRRG